MRLYVSNMSYPELREVHSSWRRHVIWWRAFGHATRDRRMLVLFGAIALVWVILGGGGLALSDRFRLNAFTWLMQSIQVAPSTFAEPEVLANYGPRSQAELELAKRKSDRYLLAANVTKASAVVLVLGITVFAPLTIGGDLMRRNLRYADSICRNACPGCGHQLTAAVNSDVEWLPCTECGHSWARAAFEPPFIIGKARSTT